MKILQVCASDIFQKILYVGEVIRFFPDIVQMVLPNRLN